MFIFENSPSFVSVGGSTLGRIAGRRPVAESKVTLKLCDKQSMQICLEKLEESDRRLAAGPKTGGNGYDWQFVLAEECSDGTSRVHFGVTWFDRDFFDKKKDVFTNDQHAGIFSQFGVSLEDVEVDHWLRVTS